MDAPASIVRLLLASVLLAAAALAVAAWAALRPAVRGTAGATEELAAVRQELAELRRSVELTRSQLAAPSRAPDLADAEHRLAALEAALRPPVRPVPSDTPVTAGAPPARDPAVERLADGTPRYTSLRAPSSAVDVEQRPSGAITVTNRDPALTGQRMFVKARTADGREEDIAITVPPPG